MQEQIEAIKNAITQLQDLVLVLYNELYDMKRRDADEDKE